MQIKMILNFQFNKEKDLENIWETANVKASYGCDFRNSVTKNIFNLCHNKKYSECKSELSKVMSNIHKSQILPIISDSVNKSWKTIEEEYFKRLENITKEKFPFRKVEVYLTTSERCPYDPDSKNPSFYVFAFANVPSLLRIAGHELMHIHLHNTPWWDKVKSELGEEKTHELKEALTEILNLEFTDLWLFTEEGYPNHTQLRKFINTQWKKEKNFNKLTDNCIKWIKKNGIK